MHLEKSHPARGAWIEIVWYEDMSESAEKSHPARGAWIETTLLYGVAPRKGCVD